MSRSTRQGFVLIAMSACMFLLLAVMGMAFDLGRVYIARNEAQVFSDAAAMAAAVQLDGSDAGVQRAKQAAMHLPMRWNLGTEEFRGVRVEFSADGSRWETEPKSASLLQYARVTVPDNRVEIAFLQAVGGPKSFTVPAHAIAAVRPVRLTE